jgi:hypothetical protein
MPVQKEQDEEKKKQAQQQNLAMVAPKPTLTPAEQAEVQQFRQREKQFISQDRESGMQQQAKQAGEKVFFAEFKRGVETVGLLLQNQKVPAQFPEVTEQTAKDLVGGAQQDVLAYLHGIPAVVNSRKSEIIAQSAEKFRTIRDEYENKLNGILGPEYSSLIYSLNGTIINENIVKSPEVREQLVNLNQWRAGEVAAMVSWREGEIKKVEEWKITKQAQPKSDVELGFLTTRVLDFYSLQGEDRARLEPSIRETLRETRSTANQAFTSERDNVYSQLKKESVAKGEG